MTEPEPTLAQELAERLGVDEPDGRLLRRLQQAIDDAESDVEGYLGRPISPVTHVIRGVWPDPFQPGAWSVASDEPIRAVVDAVPETILDGAQVIPAGTYTLTVEVGLDYLTDRELRPIRRYVTAAAMNNAELLAYLARNTKLRGPVKSVSVSTEGQSKNVTYETLSYGGGGAAGADSPGALPSIKTLDRWRWRGRRVHQAPDQPRDPRIDGAGGLIRDRNGFWNPT